MPNKRRTVNINTAEWMRSLAPNDMPFEFVLRGPPDTIKKIDIIAGQHYNMTRNTFCINLLQNVVEDYEKQYGKIRVSRKG